MTSVIFFSPYPVSPSPSRLSPSTSHLSSPGGGRKEQAAHDAHAAEAGVKSKRHMKLMLRWLMEKNQIRIKCLTHDPSAPHQAGSAGSAGSAGGAAAAAAASRGAGSGAFAAAAAGRVQPAGVKKRASKHVSVEKEFIYSIAPRYVPPSSS
ncbi:unnamed protein product [Closterium sp. Naga37s-1]|nr:unnamed protein product [Closterium sp. Naga37s-1]